MTKLQLRISMTCSSVKLRSSRSVSHPMLKNTWLKYLQIKKKLPTL
jgi:hypothetical protein